MRFHSDTTSPAHPAILEALARANHGTEPSYGADSVSSRVEQALARVFETDVKVWLVGSGTAANALTLAALCPPLTAVLAHAEAHIERDERGAAEFFTGGGKIRLLPGAHAKIDPAALEQALAADQPDFVHETPLSVVSLTNLTECGAAYTPDETAALGGPAKAAGLSVHLDGARFAAAVAGTGAAPADLTWRAGVDALAFGATKNGALGCDAIILFGAARERFEHLQAHAKRAGHMPAKMRYLAAQMEAYLADDLWLDLARTANARARDLAAALTAGDGVTLAHPVDGNEVFANMPDATADALREAGAGFHRWINGSQRFVCSWTTQTEEIAAVSRALAAHSAGAR